MTDDLDNNLTVRNMIRNFFLDKIYLDCVDENGNCFILYSAILKFYVLKISYSSIICSDSYNHVVEINSFRKSKIAFENKTIDFSNKKLNIIGSWATNENSIEVLLFHDKSNGIINWNCHHPIASCNINYKNKSY